MNIRARIAKLEGAINTRDLSKMTDAELGKEIDALLDQFPVGLTLSEILPLIQAHEVGLRELVEHCIYLGCTFRVSEHLAAETLKGD